MTIPHEEIEWQQLYSYDTSRTDLPRVLLIGDSIVAGYRDGVSNLLKDKATVTAFSTSKCVGDPDFLGEVEYAAMRFPPAVIHFNNGLHGLDFVSEEDYGKHLEQFVADLIKLAPKAKLIWASSTPVSAEKDVAALDPVLNPRVIERNRLALAIMQKNSIVVHDLYSHMVDRPEFRLEDQYHYNDDGKIFQAQKVTAFLSEHGLG